MKYQYPLCKITLMAGLVLIANPAWTQSNSSIDTKEVSQSEVTQPRAHVLPDLIFASRFEVTFPNSFSSDPNSPTALTFHAGKNVVSGQVAAPRNTRDFITFTVPSDHELTGIFLDRWSASNDNLGFAHIDNGSTSVIPTQGTASDFLGGTHVSRGNFSSTDNMLTTLSQAPQGGTGFASPLKSGDYTFNMQQTGPEESAYTLVFEIEPKLAPTTLAVSNSGSSSYVIENENDPSLTLVRGQTYTFNVNASGHPFWIKTQGVTGTGSAYNSGVNGNGLAVGQITFTVPMDAPDQLFYICQFHGSMVGDLNIVDP